MRERVAALRRFPAYVAVGAAGTAVHYALLVLLVAFARAEPVPASVAGACAGAVVNFALNAAITFRGRVRAGWRTAARFFATAASAACANGALMALCVDGLRLDYRLAQPAVTAALLGVTFAVNARWTFRARPAR